MLNARKYFSRERNLHQTGTINGLSLSRVLDIKSGKSDVLGTKWSGSLTCTWYLRGERMFDIKSGETKNKQLRSPKLAHNLLAQIFKVFRVFRVSRRGKGLE